MNWQEWAERKETKNADLRVNIQKNCFFCAHCRIQISGKTKEVYCIQMINGEKVAVRKTGNVPENCAFFKVRSKYNV